MTTENFKKVFDGFECLKNEINELAPTYNLSSPFNKLRETVLQVIIEEENLLNSKIDSLEKRLDKMIESW